MWDAGLTTTTKIEREPVDLHKRAPDRRDDRI